MWPIREKETVFFLRQEALDAVVANEISNNGGDENRGMRYKVKKT
jgi:hypothetical protein